jgi:hypothetical protein
VSEGDKSQAGKGADAGPARGDHQAEINLGINGQGQGDPMPTPPPKPADSSQSAKPEK